MNIKVVLVEDDVLLSNLLMERLKKEGYEATLVSDGNDAINIFKKVSPDLIIQDLILPNTDGYEILKIKKSIQEIRDIPVIVISNSGQNVEVKHLVEMGINDYFIKAELNLDEVVERVKTVLYKNPKFNINKKESLLRGKYILWAEDDPLIRDVVSRKIRSLDSSIEQVLEGRYVIPSIRDKKPDIIVLDMLLPDINGIEVLQSLKSNINTKDIPVLMLSNMNNKSEVDASKKYNAAGYVVKSNHSLDEVMSIMEDIIRTSKPQ